MIKSWILYGSLVLSVFALNLFVDSTAAAVLLGIIFVLPLLCILLHRFHPCKIDLCVDLPHTARKNQTIHATITAQSRSWFPCGWVRCALVCENIRTGEKISLPLSFSFPIKGQTQIPIKFKSKFCGQLTFSPSQLRFYDLWNLTYRSRSVPAAGTITILPDLFSPEVMLSADTAPNTNGSYPYESTGWDLSEPLGIKEYTPGDSPKQIHWKLTSKLDKLIVRQPGVPVENTILVLLETAYLSQPPSPPICDACAQAFICLSQNWAASGIFHTIGWMDYDTGTFAHYDIRQEDDLAGVLSKILRTRPTQDTTNCLSHYMDWGNQTNYSHIVIVTPSPEEKMQHLSFDHITFLTACSDKSQCTIPQAIPFTPETITDDLYTLII